MHKDVKYSQLKEEELARLVLSIKNSEYPLIIREACNENRTEDYWYNFVKNDCNLEADHRHIGIDGSSQKSQWWEISNQKDKSISYAYSVTPQPFHCDNPWFSNGPEINFFIMKKQAVQGGEQFFYPVSRLINDLEKLDPALLTDLLETSVVITKGDEGFENKTPILTLNDGGKVYWQYYRTVKTDKFINELCERFWAYLKGMEKSDSVNYVRCETGDAFVFHDNKMLHGRTAFKAENERDRVLLQSMWKLPSEL
tara:strand:+ start:412 stop:1176 length:765 start_codon:yes stop_codon:yes gene_type:complete